MLCKPNLKEHGQGFIEYALILVAIALAGLMVLNLFGVSLSEIYKASINAIGITPSVGEQNSEDQPANPEETPQEQSNLFEDDFSQGLGDWTFISSKFWKGTVTEQNGKMVVGPLGAAFAKGFSGKDYTISLSGTELQKKASTWEGFSVIFRSSSETANFDGYVFEIEKPKNKDTGNILFRKWENGVQIDQPISSIPVPSGFDWNNPGNVQVKVQGDTFTAYIEGQPVLTGTDSTYTEGGIGLAANFGSYLLVDQVSVESIP